MNSIHFHFNGDVNINLSLPDSADRPGYKKLVDSLEEYLHDAAEEATVTEAEADSIVMVMRPDKTPEIMQETQCWEEIESKGKYGYIVQLQIKELDECAKLLRYTSNNVNQIARRVNSGGGVYPDEVDEITAKLTEASGLFGNILEQLSKIK